MKMSLHGSSKKQDWGTPTQWFNDLNAVFGFTVDACAQPHNAKMPRYWTPEQIQYLQTIGILMREI